ncbi:MAG: hypothetical protein ACYS1A_16610 [Planctomycetota bacterium]
MSTSDKLEKTPEKTKVITTEERIVLLQKSIDEMPDVLAETLKLYDNTVNQRFETILKSGKVSTGGGGGGGDFLKDILGIINKVTSGEQQPTADKELSALAHRIVTLSLRKTLKDVEASVGAVDHVTLTHQ